MLNLDYTLCDGIGCDKQDKCYRHYLYQQAKKANYTGLIAVYNGERKDCKMFMKKKKDERK